METFGIVVAFVSILASVLYRVLSTDKVVPVIPRNEIERAAAEKGAAGGAVKPAGFAPTSPREAMMMLVSVAVLGSALFIILTDHYDGGSQKWAFGAVGSIVGFWLRPGR